MNFTYQGLYFGMNRDRYFKFGMRFYVATHSHEIGTL